MKHAASEAGPLRDPRDRLIIALDTPSLDAAREIAGGLHGAVRWFKVGPQLFTASGPAAVTALRGSAGVFRDLKFHDIPATVAGAVAAATRLGVDLLNVHALGGRPMLTAARDAAERAASAGSRPPMVIAVTLLTSGDPSVMQDAGISGTPEGVALRLAKLAQAAGLQGVVASPLDAAAIRSACGPGFLIVCPGIRHAGTGQDDQRRVLAPREAIAAGADMLVVGRPVTGASDPRRAVEEMLREISPR